MHLPKITSLITKTIETNWERQRSSKELSAFVDKLHAHVDGIELEIAL